MGNIGRTIKASDTLKHQPTVWTVPNACAQLYQPGSGQSRSQSPRAFWSAPRRADQKARGLWEREWAVAATFSSPETALLLVSTKNHDLWSSPTMKSAIHGLPVTLCMLRVKSDKSDWFWSQSIVFTKPFKTGMSLDRARGRDSWC